MVSIIDFGLAKRYRDPRSGQHIAFRNNRSLTGTARYASINSHLGLEQSRRDDLESVCYVMLYFLRGSLPWQGIPAKTKAEKYRKITESKSTTPLEKLYEGFPSICPPAILGVDELQTMMRYCRGLKFDEDPNYDYLKQLMKDVFTNQRLDYDFDFDWQHQHVSTNGAQFGGKSPFHLSEEDLDKQDFDLYHGLA